jgi:urate oxidase
MRRNPIVPAFLSHHSYGKTRIRLTKVTRQADRHDVRELTIEIQLEGDFADSYITGDNRLVIPTDTMKNVAYALAREHSVESIESFGLALAGHFLANHSHVTMATVRSVEQPLERIRVDGVEHPHAFAGKSAEARTSTVIRWRGNLHGRGGLHVESGINDLFLLKTTNSGFSGFLRDRFTTLPDCSDRLFATMLEAFWIYTLEESDVNGFEWNGSHARVRQALLQTFADHQSLSVQQTLHAMGEAALEACPQIERIILTMPNKHRILVDLKPFGLENANEVFVATDEPHGTITGTLQRAPSPAP